MIRTRPDNSSRSHRAFQLIRRRGPRRSLQRRVGVEWLEERLLLANDFGDAPAPYPTLLAGNGARHDASGPTLGANRDTAADGQPKATATGDYTSGVSDDEDGVTFGSIRVGQLASTVTVNKQARSGAGWSRKRATSPPALCGWLAA